MPIKIGLTPEHSLINAPLPPATSTYTVISHKFVIDTIRNEFAAQGFQIESEEFRCTSGANVAVGVFKIIYGNDQDLKLTYTFSNSYDKSLRFRAAIGACVNQNGGFIISDSQTWKRKHTGTADTETEDLIKDHIANAAVYFDSLVDDKEAMKNISVDKNTFGNILGELFINGFLAIDQMSVIKKEYEKPSFVYNVPENNLWALYNHILYALTTTHPSKWMTNHVAIHLFLCAKFNLALLNFDDDIQEDIAEVDYLNGEVSQEVIKDPAQIEMFVEDEEVSNSEDFKTIEEEVVDDVIEEEIIENESSENLDNGDDEDKTITKSEEVLEQSSEETEEVVKEIPNRAELGQNVFTFNNDVDEEDLDDDGLEDLDFEEADNKVVKETSDVVNKTINTPSDDAGEKIAEGADELIGELEEVYFDCADYEGVEVGDTIEEEDVYYDLTRIVTIDGDDYFVGVAMGVSDEKTLDDYQVEDALEEVTEITFESFSPVDHARLARAAVSIEELSDEDLLDQYGAMNAEEINSAISEEAVINQAEEPVVESDESLEITSEEEELLEGLSKEDDKVMTVLTEELLNLYGEEYTFTYSNLGNQYSVVLETGEVANFSKSYIDNLTNAL